MNENQSEVLGQEQSVPQEKLLPQTDVNELVRAQKEKAYNKGYQKAMEELKGATSTQTGAINPDDLSAIEQRIAEKMQNELLARQHQQYWHQTAQQLDQKVNAVKGNYPDYDQVTGQIDFLNEMPDVLAATNNFHNAGDMLYDLAKNPSKLGSVLNYLRPNSPNYSPSLARAHLAELSQSIEANKAAKNTNLPPEPLDQSTPSAIGIDNGKPMSVRDFRKMFRA